jgi:hypothetical protein
MSKLHTRKSVCGTGTSQSRQNIDQTSGEQSQEQARARKPKGKGGIPQPGQEGKNMQVREVKRYSPYITALQDLAGRSLHMKCR